jgi:hypothetical protein
MTLNNMGGSGLSWAFSGKLAFVENEWLEGVQPLLTILFTSKTCLRWLLDPCWLLDPHSTQGEDKIAGPDMTLDRKDYIAERSHIY